VVLDQGAMVIDTPGMRDSAYLGAAEGFAMGFEEIHALSAQCRYADAANARRARLRRQGRDRKRANWMETGMRTTSS
jgi:hypothetical protein